MDITLLKENRQFVLRVIFATFVLVYLFTQLPWVQKALLKWDFPELRHQVVPLQAINFSNGQWIAEINNLGPGPATKLLIRLHFPENIVDGYGVITDEIYEIKSYDPAKGGIVIFLERLAPGAYIRIGLNGHIQTKDQIQLVAVCDQGYSIPVGQQTFNEQVNTTAGIFQKAGVIIRSSQAAQDWKEFSDNLSFLSDTREGVISENFKVLFQLTFIVFLGIIAFVSKKYLPVVIPAYICLTVILLITFLVTGPVSVYWLIGVIVIGAMLFVIYLFSDFHKTWAAILFFAMILVCFLLWYFFETVSILVVAGISLIPSVVIFRFLYFLLPDREERNSY